MIESFEVGNLVARSDTGMDIDFANQPFMHDVYEYSAAIDFTFDGGTTYWMVIQNDTVGQTSSDNFFWTNSPGGNTQQSFDGGTTWNPVDFSQDFTLISVERPADDDYFGSQLTLPFENVTGTNFNGTVEVDEQELDITGSTTWWFFVADETGMVTIDTFGSNYDTQLHIYTGFDMGFPNLEPVANNDDSGGLLQSEVTFAVEAGECYDIRVGGFKLSLIHI